MLQPSATELVEFVSALKLCVRRFYESDSRELTSDEVGAELNMDSIGLRKLYDLIHDAYHVTVGSYGPDVEGQWKIQIDEDVHLFKDVNDIRDYIDVQTRLNPTFLGPVQPRTLRA
jgi:hypothetical protein